MISNQEENSEKNNESDISIEEGENPEQNSINKKEKHIIEKNNEIEIYKQYKKSRIL